MRTIRQLGSALLVAGLAGVFLTGCGLDDKARDVAQSPKLWALFGTQGAVDPGKVYGEIAQGTARVLYTRIVTRAVSP